MVQQRERLRLSWARRRATSVHYSSIQIEGYKSLKEGDEVEFDIIEGSKGQQADHVVRLREGGGPS